MQKEMVRRYSQAFKQQVVREYEKGASIYRLMQKYGVRGHKTIQNWIKQYGQAGLRNELVVIQTVEDQLELKALKAQVTALEAALAAAVVENRLLQATVAVASQAYGVDIKKNFGKGSSPRWSAVGG
jgi:transposase-like protein